MLIAHPRRRARPRDRGHHARSRARAAWSPASPATPCSPTRRSSAATRSRTSPGIHQDGVLKERSTYEIMDATTVGLEGNAIVLGKHWPPRAASALEELGFVVDGQALNTAFKRFKEIADRKKQVTAMDLEALVTDELRDDRAGYTLEWFDVDASNRRPPHARVASRRPTGELVVATSRATARSTRSSAPSTPRRSATRGLREFRIDAVTGGQDALGEASVVLELHGQSAAGQGVSTDIIEAAGRPTSRA